MSLEIIGQLAIELHAATWSRKHAKDDLREKYAEFCSECGLCRGDQDLSYVGEDHPSYPAMQAHAAVEVLAYRRAQLDEYNLKRKLDRAVRRHTLAEQRLKRALAVGGAQ